MPGPSPSVVTKLINALGDKTPTLVKKHPSLVAGAAGLGLGAANSAGPAHRLESDIMREHLGAPGAKYSACQAMEKFAERKMQLAAKVSFEKVAFPGDQDSGRGGADLSEAFESGMGRAAGGNVVTEGIKAIRRLLGFTAQTVSDQFVDEPKRQKIIGELQQKDPVISQAEKQTPGQALQAYQTMRRFAPTLSTDPNATAAFLRNAVMTGGPMDYQTIRGLADTETSIQRAQNEGAWLRGGF